MVFRMPEPGVVLLEPDTGIGIGNRHPMHRFNCGKVSSAGQ